jgi:hypothetical protein
MRIFNANVGDHSTGNAGPDAIEQDLDNLYRDKADKTEVLTKDNTIPYTPTQNYHPATKMYVDTFAVEQAGNVFINNTNIESVNTEIVNSDNAQLMNSWTKDLLVETLNTNFEDFVIGSRVDNGAALGNTKLTRDYLKTEKEGISFKHQELSLVAVDYKINNQQVYYTTVRGTNAYKFLSIINPILIAGTWKADVYYKPHRIIKGEDNNYYYVLETYSPNGYKTFANALPHLVLTTEEQHKVKVKTIVSEQEKANIQFQDVSGIKEVLLTLGLGDGILDKSAKAEIYKGVNGLEVNYYKSNTGEKMNLKLDDTGIHSNIPIYNSSGIVRNIIVTDQEPNASMGNVNDIILKKKV